MRYQTHHFVEEMGSGTSTTGGKNEATEESTTEEYQEGTDWHQDGATSVLRL